MYMCMSHLGRLCVCVCVHTCENVYVRLILCVCVGVQMCIQYVYTYMYHKYKLLWDTPTSKECGYILCCKTTSIHLRTSALGGAPYCTCDVQYMEHAESSTFLPFYCVNIGNKPQGSLPHTLPPFLPPSHPHTLTSLIHVTCAKYTSTCTCTLYTVCAKYRRC